MKLKSISFIAVSVVGWENIVETFCLVSYYDGIL